MTFDCKKQQSSVQFSHDYDYINFTYPLCNFSRIQNTCLIFTKFYSKPKIWDCTNFLRRITNTFTFTLITTFYKRILGGIVDQNTMLVFTVCTHTSNISPSHLLETSLTRFTLDTIKPPNLQIPTSFTDYLKLKAFLNRN